MSIPPGNAGNRGNNITVMPDSGIYQPFLFYDRDSNKELYGHCAKLLGWGDENGVNYWLYMNTWGREWGENGKLADGYSNFVRSN
jgi:cathepsin B